MPPVCAGFKDLLAVLALSVQLHQLMQVVYQKPASIVQWSGLMALAEHPA